MTTHNNEMSHATHDLATEAKRLREGQGFGAAGARKLAKQYAKWPETAAFFADMAVWYEENPE